PGPAALGGGHALPRRAGHACAVRGPGARARARSAVPRGLGIRTHAAGARRAVAGERRRVRCMVGRAARKALGRRPCTRLHAGRARWRPCALVPAAGDAPAALRPPWTAARGPAPDVRPGVDRARRTSLALVHALGTATLLAHPAPAAALAGAVLPRAHRLSSQRAGLAAAGGGLRPGTPAPAA